MPLLGLGRRFAEFRFILAKLKAHDVAKGLLAACARCRRPAPARYRGDAEVLQQMEAARAAWERQQESPCKPTADQPGAPKCVISPRGTRRRRIAALTGAVPRANVRPREARQ